MYVFLNAAITTNFSELKPTKDYFFPVGVFYTRHYLKSLVRVIIKASLTILDFIIIFNSPKTKSPTPIIVCTGMDHPTTHHCYLAITPFLLGLHLQPSQDNSM
jgi:hypothetical protein